LAIFPEIWRSLSRYREQRGKIMPIIPEIITENVIKQLEQGVAPWREPWSTSIPRDLISKRPYRGLNVFTLATQGYWRAVVVNAEKEEHERKRKRKTLLSEKKEVCSKNA
jgi:hypothetical protein